MRKFGSTKRNPNPPWPGVQQGIVLPPGTNMSAIGRTNGIDKENENIVVKDREIESVDMRNAEINPVHTRDGFLPIMSYMNEGDISGILPDKAQNRGCASMNVSDYLCDKVGNYARVEFLFGENSHVEKTGVIESVGKDFLVLGEAGTGSHIVCSSKNIKFINIYNLK